ncbi:MAG: hypothetical protein AB8G26_00120 [Ilumatobacter sp.]
MPVWPARLLWQRIETIHAVTYFAPESIGAARAAGLRGFWMGYFGFRACPLGAVGPEPVEAAFANFAGPMVARAVPDAWTYARPEQLRRIRAESAAGALRRCSTSVVRSAAEASDALSAAIAEASPLGRPMFAANRSVELLDDPVGCLWQQCTTLREHRGDGHVAALAAAGVDGCEAHLLLAADQGIDPHVFLEHRGWTSDQQEAARERLSDRGLLLAGVLTEVGHAVRADVESITDRIAAEPFLRSIGEPGLLAAIDALTPAALEVARSGILPFPNPMGLPQLAAG